MTVVDANGIKERHTLLKGAVHVPSGSYDGMVSPLLIQVANASREVQCLNGCYIANMRKDTWHFSLSL
jgi:hypothetical protein